MREPEKGTNAGSLISLSDWIPWQNRLQETHMIDHSLETRHMVELLEFTDLQGGFPPLTESIIVHSFSSQQRTVTILCCLPKLLYVMGVYWCQLSGLDGNTLVELCMFSDSCMW